MYEVVLKSIMVLFLVLLTGCADESSKKSLDGKSLIVSKCASCHNLDLPPKIFEDELAPPMMAVSHHVLNQIKVRDESQRVASAVAFVKEYVITPDITKAFCDDESLKLYGLMPSQKNNVTSEELDAITSHMFTYFTQENLSIAQENLNKFNAMSKGEQLAYKNNCFGCHRIEKNLVGPSFKTISNKYTNDKIIINSIKEGSRNKYKEAGAMVMPSFKKMSEEDVKTIAKWILQTK